VPTSGEPLRVFRLAGGIEGRPESIEPATFASVGALELQHVEQWLKKEPSVLGENLLIIASQLTGFDKTRDRPDHLAIDTAGKLVVVEIKRHDAGSAQDLQALRYAAYVSTLQSDQVVELFRMHRKEEHGETLPSEQARERLEDFAGGEPLEALDEDEQPRMILVAPGFRAGVTNTALWLIRNFGLDITCVQLVPYSVDGSLVLTSTVLIPLPEAADMKCGYRKSGGGLARLGRVRSSISRPRARSSPPFQQVDGPPMETSRPLEAHRVAHRPWEPGSFAMAEFQTSGGSRTGTVR